MDSVISILLAQDSLDRSQPIAQAGGPYSFSARNAAILNGSGSRDPQGLPLSYGWDLDGSSQFSTAADSNTLVHVFGGAYSGYVALAVTNAAGNVSVDYAYLAVTATNQPPVFDSVTHPVPLFRCRWEPSTPS